MDFRVRNHNDTHIIVGMTVESGSMIHVISQSGEVRSLSSSAKLPPKDLTELASNALAHSSKDADEISLHDVFQRLAPLLKEELLANR